MEKTNVLLITSDQQHFMTLGINNKDISTPNLDRLASLGMVSERAYCPNPTCTPTRASIITGQYPSQHGAWTLGTKLNESKKTIGDHLLEDGYTTSLVGKAHFQQTKQTKEYSSIEALPIIHDVDFWKNYHTKFYGFENIELLRGHTNEYLVGQHYMLWLEAKGFSDWKKYFLEPIGEMTFEKYKNEIELLAQNDGDISKIEKNWGIWDIPEEAHYNTFISERTNYYIEKAVNEDKPFFIWASFPDPHPDYFVPSKYASMYDPKELSLQMREDFELNTMNPITAKTQEMNPDFSEFEESGYCLHGLHSHIQDEESLRQDVAWYYGMVTFMDKHIGKILDKLEEMKILDDTVVIFTTDHGHYFGQHGLIRKGPFHYEDALKVPFLVSYPKKIMPNWKSNSLNSLVDLAPTILDIIGCEIPRSMTGISQKDVWYGIENNAREWVICENRHEQSKLNLRTYIDQRYKLTVFQNQSFGDLYDLKNDPLEQNNLWNNPDYSNLKMELLQKFINAELQKEMIMMPRIANA